MVDDPLIIHIPPEDWGPCHAAQATALLEKGYRKVGDTDTDTDVIMGLMPGGAGGIRVFFVPSDTPEGSLRSGVLDYKWGDDKTSGGGTIVPTAVSLTVDDFRRIFGNADVSLVK